MLRKDISKVGLFYLFAHECIDIKMTTAIFSHVSDLEPSETIGVVTEEKTRKLELRCYSRKRGGREHGSFSKADQSTYTEDSKAK